MSEKSLGQEKTNRSSIMSQKGISWLLFAGKIQRVDLAFVISEVEVLVERERVAPSFQIPLPQAISPDGYFPTASWCGLSTGPMGKARFLGALATDLPWARGSLIGLARSHDLPGSWR